MIPDLQLAESVKYSSALVWHFAEIRPGLFALYNHERHEILLTSDWNEVLTHYRQRPKYVPKPKLKLEKIDLSKLEINL